MKVDKLKSDLIEKNLENNSKLYLLDQEKFRLNINKNSLKSNINNTIYLPNESGEYEHFDISKTKQSQWNA